MLLSLEPEVELVEGEEVEEEGPLPAAATAAESAGPISSADSDLTDHAVE